MMFNNAYYIKKGFYVPCPVCGAGADKLGAWRTLGQCGGTDTLNTCNGCGIVRAKVFKDESGEWCK